MRTQVYLLSPFYFVERKIVSPELLLIDLIAAKVNVENTKKIMLIQYDVISKEVKNIFFEIESHCKAAYEVTNNKLSHTDLISLQSKLLMELNIDLLYNPQKYLNNFFEFDPTKPIKLKLLSPLPVKSNLKQFLFSNSFVL